MSPGAATNPERQFHEREIAGSRHPSGRSRALLIDDAEYSTTVIRQGSPIPWTDTTMATTHFDQVRALLNPDALWVDMGRLFLAHTDSRPDLVTAMGARTRVGYPLRTLLTDSDVLAASREMMETVAKTARRRCSCMYRRPRHGWRPPTRSRAIPSPRWMPTAPTAHRCTCRVAGTARLAAGRAGPPGRSKCVAGRNPGGLYGHDQCVIALRLDTGDVAGRADSTRPKTTPSIGLIGAGFWTEYRRPRARRRCARYNDPGIGVTGNVFSINSQNSADTECIAEL